MLMPRDKLRRETKIKQKICAWSRIVQKGHNMYECYYTDPTTSFTHGNAPKKHHFRELQVKITLTKQDKKRTALCNPRITFKHSIYRLNAPIRAIETLEKCQNNI